MNGRWTLFSSEMFVNAWVSAIGQETRTVAIRVGSGASQSSMHGVGTPCGGGFQVEFGPDGLYACPEPFLIHPDNELADALVQLTRNGFLSVKVNVRFDHGDLAAQLQDKGLAFQRSTTHIIQLGKSHDELFAAYSATHKKHVRRFHRQGATIRRADTYKDIVAYCAVHEKLAQQKAGFRVKYPISLIDGLVKLRDHTALLVAEFDGRIIAGLLSFRDGNSMLAWHLASDRDYERLYASAALYDGIIQIAGESGLVTLNLGGSPTDSLRDFKTSFGALPQENWHFSIKSRKQLLKQAMGKLRRIFGWRSRQRCYFGT